MRSASARKYDSIVLHEIDRPVDTMAVDVHAGLARAPKRLPPKYFYDRKGSALFDAITELDEYYLTRTEIGLIERFGAEMAALIGEGSILFELGSGSSLKIRLLLDALRPRVYVPIDISRDHLVDSAQALAEDYPWLEVHAACVDYSRHLRLPDLGEGRHTAFFPGSSIGNFDHDAAQRLLSQIGRLVGPGGGLLIGVDLKKEVGILENAYNDAQGVTAEFNLNMLEHINRHLDADFEIDRFAHKAFYDTDKGRVEMHLESQAPQRVSCNGNVYRFERGETIHTESSYKYTIAEFQALARRAGLTPVRVWTDAERLFSIHYLTVEHP